MTTLREVQAFLQTVDTDFVFSIGFRSPHSWRGVYSEVAFQSRPSVGPRCMLDAIEEATSKTFEGWKGGEYSYNLDNHGHLEAGGEGYYTETAEEEFTTVFQAMKLEWFDHKMKTEQKPARKTAAQKRAEAQAARDLELQQMKTEFAETYESRLLKLVHAYMSEYGLNVSAYSNSFQFSNILLLAFILSAWSEFNSTGSK
jgi:hypothetical protein